MRALQPADRGLGPEARRTSSSTPARTTRARRVEAKPAKLGKHVVLRVDRADGFVGTQHALPRRARVRLLRRGDGRRPARQDEVLLERRLRPPELHHRPQPRSRTATASARATRSSTRAPRRRRARRPTSPSIPTRRASTRWSRSATCAARSSATRARWATRSASPTTTSTATRPASRRTRCRAAGHPGFPADSSEIDHNFIYSNNFNVYADDSQVKPLVTVPVGTGIVYAGMNDAEGPRQLVLRQLALRRRCCSRCRTRWSTAAAPRATIQPGVALPGRPGQRHLDLLRQPLLQQQDGPGAAGLHVPEGARPVRRPAQRDLAATTMPNGDGLLVGRVRDQHRQLLVRQPRARTASRGSVTGPGRRGPAARPRRRTRCPDCAGGKDPGSSVGAGDVAKVAYALDCSNGPDKDTGPMDCDWWAAPAKPGSAEAAPHGRRSHRGRRGVRRARRGGQGAGQAGRASSPCAWRRRLRWPSPPSPSRAAAAASPTEPRRRRPATAKPVGKANQGSVVQFADCGDWNKGDARRRSRRPSSRCAVS